MTGPNTPSGPAPEIKAASEVETLVKVAESMRNQLLLAHAG